MSFKSLSVINFTYTLEQLRRLAVLLYLIEWYIMAASWGAYNGRFSRFVEENTEIGVLLAYYIASEPTVFTQINLRANSILHNSTTYPGGYPGA
jgi:hypothetical protein